MVKRFAFLLVLVLALMWSRPASAQDFSRFDMGFGYGNYGVEDATPGFTAPVSRRANGFVMHTDINLVRWFTFENVLGAYKMNNNITLVTNTFGTKIVARDLADGRVSPYVAAGFGFGYFSSNQTGGGFNTSSGRYAAGIDLNMSDAMAVRFDVGGLALSTSIGTPDWHSDLNVTVAVMFRLGY